MNNLKLDSPGSIGSLQLGSFLTRLLGFMPSPSYIHSSIVQESSTNLEV